MREIKVLRNKITKEKYYPYLALDRKIKSAFLLTGATNHIF